MEDLLHLIQSKINLSFQIAWKSLLLIGNGSALVAEGRVRELEVKIQGHVLKLPVYFFHVTGTDLVLGATWLAMIGAHISDYSKLTLKFYLGNQFVTLQGDQPYLPMPAQFHHLRRMHHTHAIEELFTLQFKQKDYFPDQGLVFPTNIAQELTALLHNYSVVFSVPIGLPPQRSHNHSISLLLGSTPVKVCPYQYPHSQKEQIEIMVQETLTAGIIVPNNNPFSSSIILVKKKDSIWRFCTNYRALNGITVKDSFLIPIVNELTDELHRAKFLSKLDLCFGYHQILVNEKDKFNTAFRTH